MPFTPSRQSYGFYGEEPIIEEGEEDKKKGAGWQQYLPAVRSFLFGEGAREEAAIVAQQIENLRRKIKAGVPGFLHNIYIDEIEKKKARLVELQAMASDEKSAAEKESVTRTAVAVMGILGAVLVGGMVFNQVQKARLLQAKIRKEG